VGPLDPDFAEIVLRSRSRLKLPAQASWETFSGPEESFSLLNLASVVALTDHVASLEGLTDSANALGRTRFVNLPWWMTCIWLPVQFHVPAEPVVHYGDDPIFVGSCAGLLEDLAAVRDLSNLSLGESPPGYAEMRRDYEAFLGDWRTFELKDERDVIRWVWRGLHDAAELALQRGCAMTALG
jgi:hypothetical protein